MSDFTFLAGAGHLNCFDRQGQVVRGSAQQVDGTWTPWLAIPTPAPNTPYGSAIGMDAAVDPVSGLICVTVQGSTGKCVGTIRHTDGTWTAWFPTVPG